LQPEVNVLIFQERVQRMQVDKMSETLAEMHSKADREEARQAELEEQACRITETKHESVMVCALC
jgi:hypothetical protein